MRTYTVSVRKLVEFLLRSGDIAPAASAAAQLEAMQAGSDVHRRLQAMAGSSYKAEVALAHAFYCPGGDFVPEALRLDIAPETVERTDPRGFFIKVEGRADGVVDPVAGSVADDAGVSTVGPTIDEIKGTYADVGELTAPLAVHDAQARCYAYLYLRSVRERTGDSATYRNRPVAVRLTYVGLETGEVRRLTTTYWCQELEEWFFDLLRRYHRWVAWRARHVARRDERLRELVFPYAYRRGQRELVEEVGGSIAHGGTLYLQAPTGSGKTIGTVYPALVALGYGAGDRVVYLTAKTMARQAVLACLELLNGGGEDAHTREGAEELPSQRQLGRYRPGQRGAGVLAVQLTAKDKICPLKVGRAGSSLRAAGQTTPCNPVECPYARGHFDRINDAAFDVLAGAREGAVVDRAAVLRAAERHRVCPYELQLEVGDWADVLVGDYNYVFTPSASLRCLGEDPERAILLVDEAHNLVDRARDNYSADLEGGEFRRVIDVLGAAAGSVLATHGETDLAYGGFTEGGNLDGPGAQKAQSATLMSLLAKAAAWFGGRQARLADGRQGERSSYRVCKSFGNLPALLEELVPALQTYLNQVPPEEQVADPYILTRNLTMRILSFQGAFGRAADGEGYVLYEEALQGGNTRAKVFCADPSGEVGGRLGSVRAAVLFSATLLPLDYYRKLLGASPDDRTATAASCFDPAHRAVLIGADVSMRYSRRDRGQYLRVARYIQAVVTAKKGNYLVFLPSYHVLEEVSSALDGMLPADVRVVRQGGRMSETARERFLAAFRAGAGAEPDGAAGVVGLCVLGGFFAESVDLRGEALIGVVVVGVGLPGLSAERDLVREQFDGEGNDGFAYAYTYPGMTKVLQAAGRLVRTEADRGVVLLLDERFDSPSYRALFPEEWGSPRACTVDDVDARVASFWRGLPVAPRFPL